MTGGESGTAHGGSSGGGTGIPERVKVGLALAGGGGRGLAHVGVLRVLEREGIRPDLITGTSIGAVIGGIYACHPDADALEETVLRFIREREMEGLNLRLVRRIGAVSQVDDGRGKRDREEPTDEGVLDRLQRRVRQLYASHRALSRMALLEEGQLLEAMESLFGERTFEDVEIPFAAVAVDINAGCEVIITRGPLARGIGASAAMAGIFPPVSISGRKLIDGGYTSPVPIEAAQTLGANVVLAVDVSLAERNADHFANAVEVGIRSGEISRVALEREQLRRADVVIPARMVDRHWSDFSAAEEAIARGERSAENLVDSIRAVLEERARLFV